MKLDCSMGLMLIYGMLLGIIEFYILEMLLVLIKYFKEKIKFAKRSSLPEGEDTI